jgi:hypothetical protein
MGKKILLAGICSVILLAITAAFLLFNSRSHADILPDDVFCVISVNSGTYVKENTVYVKQGDDISIMPVFIINGEFYSNVKVFIVDGEFIPAKRQPKIKYSWYCIDPAYKEDGYDNFIFAPKKQFSSYLEPISYLYSQILKSGELRLSDITIDGFGSYYVQLVPGKAAPVNFESVSASLIAPDVLQIIFRSEDSYLGYLSELMRSPFIMYPKQTALGHQTDLLIGSDCAEFAIYGMRRLGFDIPYCGPHKLYQYLTQISENDPVLPGDILHYGSQVAVYYESESKSGKIGDDDILLQSYGAKPYFTTIRENSMIFGDYKIYRFSAK